MNVLDTSTKASFFDIEPMFIYDYHSFKIVDVSEKAIEMYGYTKEEFLSKKISDLGKKVRIRDLNKIQSVDFNPTEVWKHKSRNGKEWHVQLTTHHFKFQDKPVKIAIAHNVEHLINQEEIQIHSFPKIDTVQAHIPMGMVEWDRDYNVRDWSEKTSDIFGWSYDEVIGKNIFELDFFPKELISGIKQKFQNLVSINEVYFSVDSKHITKSGKQIFCRWHNAIVYDSSGNAVSIFSMLEDNTEKREASLKLKESEAKFRVLAEASIVGIYMIQDGVFKYVNPRLCEMSGYNQQELVDKVNPVHLVHPENVEKFSRMQKLWKQSYIDSFEVELKINTKDFSTLHIKTYGSTIQLNGRPALIGVSLDQTEQVMAAKELKTSLKSYKSLFDSINDAIYIQNADAEFIEVNRGATKMYGYEKAEFLGKTPDFLSAPGKVDMDDALEKFDLALNGTTQTFIWWGKRKNGEVFPKEITLSPGHYFGEKVVIALGRNISEKYEKDKKLKQNEELFRQLFQNSPLGIALLDQHNDAMMVNDGFERIFGYTIDDVKGLSLDKIIVPDEKLAHAERLSNSEEPFTYTSKRKHKTGKIVDVLICGVPVKLEGKTIAIYGIYVDISDRIKSEQKNIESLKEKEILLSEIHHRVKNNLAVITGLLELQSHNLESLEAKTALKDSQLRINSMALIHEKLYQSESLSQISFNRYIKELIDVIRSSHEIKDTDLSVKMDVDNIKFPITKAIPCGLIINEIVTNSFKHAFDGIANPSISISLKKDEDDIVLSIFDNGVGLPDKFENLKSSSLGIILIKTLSKQIDSSLSVNGVQGTKYSLRFNISKNETV
ncbi:MAG: PAS domain S-box protein [Balneolaceae bacterium]